MVSDRLKSLLFSGVLAVLLFSSNALLAQKYADKGVYLIDSLVLDSLSEFDRELIEHHMAAYKRATALDRLAHIDSIINISNDHGLQRKYNDLLLIESSDQLLSLNEGTEEWQRASGFKANYYNNMAIVFDYAGLLDSALVYYGKALKYYKGSKQKQAIGETMNMIAVVYKNQGDFFRALNLIDSSLNYLQYDNPNTIICFTNSANFHLIQDNYEDALFFQTEALKIAKNLDDPEKIAVCHTHIASSKRFMNKFSEADSLVSLALAALDTFENPDPYDYIHAIDEQAHLLFDQKRYEASKTVFEKELSLSEDLDYEYLRLISTVELANINFILGNYAESEKQGMDAYNVAKEYDLPVVKGKALDILVKLSERNGDYKQAFEYQALLNLTNDKIKDEEKKTASIKQMINYQYVKQREIDSVEQSQEYLKQKALDQLKNDYEIDLVESDKKKTQLRLVFAIVVAVLVLLAALIIYNRLKLIRKQKTQLDAAYAQLEETKKLELAASNLKAIKSQMNPHFIFNSINSIQDSILQQDKLSSYDHMVVFSKLVRTVLNHSEQEFISISEELTFLETYLNLEKIRFKDDFSYVINNHIASEGILIPSLIIQPFLENSIKHGLLHKSGQKNLTVTLNALDDDQIQCVVKDNGIGISEATQIKASRKKHRSFSTQAIEQRLDLLSEHTSKKAYFRLEDDFDQNGEVIGAKAIIVLPVKFPNNRQ